MVISGPVSRQRMRHLRANSCSQESWVRSRGAVVGSRGQQQEQPLCTAQLPGPRLWDRKVSGSPRSQRAQARLLNLHRTLLDPLPCRRGEMPPQLRTLWGFSLPAPNLWMQKPQQGQWHCRDGGKALSVGSKTEPDCRNTKSRCWVVPVDWEIINLFQLTIPEGLVRVDVVDIPVTMFGKEFVFDLLQSGCVALRP